VRDLDGGDIIEMLGLRRHPEGGWFRSTWRAPSARSSRPPGSAIYYLLRADEMARRHRIDATEIWHHYLGDPLELVVESFDGSERAHVLGPDLRAGQRPQIIVPAGAWQRARPLGSFVLVGCTVSPAFEARGWELTDDQEGETG
jgi:uncharacterized protein